MKNNVGLHQHMRKMHFKVQCKHCIGGALHTFHFLTDVLDPSNIYNIFSHLILNIIDTQRSKFAPHCLCNMPMLALAAYCSAPCGPIMNSFFLADRGESYLKVNLYPISCQANQF